MNTNIEGLELYEKVRIVPAEAQKPIGAGRLKGMTDINPMWRIKCLTEQFGPCGLGWSYEITRQWIEEGSEGQKVAFTNINLYVKYEEWSRAIPGTGGSGFINKESKGLYTSDECFKMSLTDAISVACKALGVGANIYFQKDRTKYDNPITSIGGDRANKQSNNINTPTNNKNASNSDICCEDCGKKISEKVGTFSTSKYGKKLCMDCQKKEVK